MSGSEKTTSPKQTAAAAADAGDSAETNSRSQSSYNLNLQDTKEKQSPDKTTAGDVEESSGGEDKENKGSIKDYLRIFQYASRFDLFLYAVSLTGAIIVGAALPMMALIFGSSTKAFNDFASGRVDPTEFQHTVNKLVLYFVYLFVGRFVLAYITTLCICIAAARTTNSIRKAFLECLLRKDMSHFDMQGNGAVATQVTTNGNRINHGIAEKLYSFVQGLSLFFSAFIVALAVKPVLAIITMSIVPGIVLIAGGSIAIDAPNEARITRIYSHAATIAQDALLSVKTVFAFNAQQKIVQLYEDDLRAAHKLGNKKSAIYGVLFACQYFFVLAGVALAFWQGFRMFQNGSIPNVGTVFTVVLSVTLGATSVTSFMPCIMSITNAISAAVELFTIMDKQSALDPLSGEGKRPSSCAGDIEFREVQFAYPSRPTATVLHGLNLSIPARKTTALVGPSGCGKSTVVGLLERWYQPESGQVLIDGCDVSELNTNWLRSNIRLVQQEPTLFSGTIFENVAKGFVGDQHTLSKQSQMELVEEACKAADAHNFISQLPEGYQTKLGERGGTLSGGQLQRVSIARSIISDPKVLLFDEATSALDPRAEKVVQDALSRVSVGKTTLIIAHKLATVMAADNIAVMNNGIVVEQGTHSELVNSNGLYAAMVGAQDLGAGSSQHDSGDNDFSQDGSRQVNEWPHLQLEQTQTDVAVETQQDSVEYLSAGTVGYSLLKCIIIMIKENRALYPWYYLNGAAYIMVGGTYPAQAVLFSHLIQVFTLEPAEGKRQADFYALMFFVLALANLVGYFAIGVTTNVIGQTMTHRYRREMLENMMSFDMDFFDCPENTSGSLTANLSSVPEAVQELMSSNLGLLLTVVVNVISTSILGIAFGWKLGLAMTFGGLTVIVGSGVIRIRMDQILEARTGKQFSQSASLAAEAVAAIKTVSLLTMETSVLDEYGRTLDEILSKVTRSLSITLIPYAFSQSAEFLVLALGFWYGCRLVAHGEYTATQFFTIFIAVVFGGQAAAQLFMWTTSITKATSNANYIFWLRTIKPQICRVGEGKEETPSADNVSIEAEDVEFRYKQRKATKVLKGISMKIKPGAYAAFVGPSGCGKSTVISLLERFYDPTSGSLKLNDKDIKQLSPNLYRQQMSLVQQNPPLYLGSIRDNISIGLDYEPSDDEIYSACTQANALEFITSLPEGLNTQCGSRGTQFSGGQRQRIAVARALIRKPRLLLLDEATSALDTHSERIVQEALFKAASSRTTVAVAHRLSTIRHADVIFVIEDGRITEMGTHEELQAAGGRYRAMCLAQSLDQT